MIKSENYRFDVWSGNVKERFFKIIKPMRNQKCPFCNETLSIVLHGLVRDEYLKQLRKEGVPFYNGGCCCYGDDRDAVYYCSSCKERLDEKFQVINLITCPRVIDYKIRKEECGNEKILKRKYCLKNKMLCEACKIISNNSDEEYRKAAHIIGLSEETIRKVIYKKNSNLRLKSNMLYKRYLCEEEEVIRRVEYWHD